MGKDLNRKNNASVFVWKVKNRSQIGVRGHDKVTAINQFGRDLERAADYWQCSALVSIR